MEGQQQSDLERLKRESACIPENTEIETFGEAGLNMCDERRSEKEGVMGE